MTRPTRVLPSSRLSPHPAVRAAYAMWLSVPRRVVPCPVQVIRENGKYLWFGGFPGLGLTWTEQVEAQVFRGLPDDYLDRAWEEAASPTGVRDWGRWYQLLCHHLPQTQATRLLGVHGLTKAGASRYAGIARQTLYNGLSRTA